MRLRTIALLPTVILVLLTGCQTARVDRPLTLDHGGNDDFEQLEFWHALADRPVTSNDDAFHGLLLFLDGSDPATGYAGRVGALKSRGLLPANFDQPAEQAVERGTLAVAIVRALKIQGGLAIRLVGTAPLNGRYAVRELQFLELYPPSSPNQTFSGTEFLGIIGKLEDYRRGQGRRGGSRRGLQVPAEPRPGVEPQREPVAAPAASGQPL